MWLIGISGQPFVVFGPFIRSFLMLGNHFSYSKVMMGIFHAYLNLTNGLHHSTPSGSDFCLIDNNRIRFRSYTRRRAMRNLRRIQMPLVNYAALVDEHARLAHQDVFETYWLMMFYRSFNRDLCKLKRFFKELNPLNVLAQKY